MIGISIKSITALSEEKKPLDSVSAYTLCAHSTKIKLNYCTYILILMALYLTVTLLKEIQGFKIYDVIVKQ